MRILHTSDWHLGRSLHGVDLIDAQAAFLDHLVDTVGEQSVDLVVVAGDVYDRAVPPVDAVRLLGSALARLCKQAHVLVLSGNHDSATRLGFGAGLFTPRLHVRTELSTVGRPVELSDQYGPVLAYPIPYLDPEEARYVLAGISPDGDDRIPPLDRSHEAVMAGATARIRADLAARGGTEVRSIAVAHAFVIGGKVCESERDIRVGGVDCVHAEVFDGLDYVALGHLHGPQTLTTRECGTQLRYAGSPLAYSFSEAEHHKSSWLVELGPNGVTRVDAVPAPVPRRMSTVRGTLESLLGAAGEAHLEHWLRVVVTDDERPVELVRRVKARFPHALLISHEPVGLLPAPRTTPGPVVDDPRAVAIDFLGFAGGRSPAPTETDVLDRAWDRVLSGERSA